MRIRHQTRGFTLVELLVVIGIIAVLIAMLLPSLVTARASALSLKCLSNLRQMTVAAQIYVNANHGAYPPAIASGTDGTFAYSYNWDFTVATNLSTFKVTLMPGLLWSGQTNPQIQQCPAFTGKSMTLYDPYTGYNYNTSYIGRGKVGSVFDGPTKAVQVRNASQTALFGDGQYLSGANKFMRSPTASGYISDGLVPSWSGTQGFRHHKKSTNVGFADGHAENIPWRDEFTAGQPVATGTGFLSKDNTLYDLR